jgi:cytochrome bd ubiquinol oxidase subunit I
VALSFAALAAPAQVLVGDWAARTVAERQPVKLAAFEGLHKTEKGAPLEIVPGVEAPKALALLAFHDPNATVKGLDTVPRDDQPPVGIVKTSFRVMVGLGTGFALLGAWFIWMWWRRGRLPGSVWFPRLLVAAGPLSVVALIAGWVTTEVGRQPWVVYGLMRTEDAVTGAGGIPVGYGTLVVVYAALAGAAAWMLRRLARSPLEVGGGDG